MNERENYLRTVEFRRPEWIPCRVTLLPVMWKKYRESLEEIVLAHPRIFPGYRKGGQNFGHMPPGYRKEGYY